MHDMQNIADFTKERLDRVDKIAVLSEFHKKQIKMDENGTYVEIPDDKFFLTRNGIPDLGITSWKGNPHRMCYVSSPDRGLIYLLKMWPKIKEAVPDAELHVYYGFDVYDFIHRGNPAKKAFKEKILSMMKQEGITYHGRLGHKELAEEVNKCGVWAYPTDFDEISCISAMKCQALGAVPCVTNKSALQETVKNGIKVDVDIQDKTGQQAYVEALINLLQHPEEQEDLRNMSWAQSYFSWANVAEQWTTLLRTGNAPTTAMMSPAEWIKYLAAKKSEVKK
jgi:glycosyltransferase involved in cell wall biosynthesis